MTLAEIETLTKTYAEARGALAERARALEDELAAAKRRHLSALRRLVDRAAAAHGALHDALEGSPALFERPRSVILHGVRVGWQKGRGKLCFEDADQVLKLIRRHFPDRVDELIKVSEAPVRAALERLSVAEMARLGVTLEGAGDQVVIKPTDGEVERMVDALLRAATAEATAA